MSKLTLVPPADPPPSDVDSMNEEQARAYLKTLRSPNLDALRARIPTMETSELFTLVVSPPIIAEALNSDAKDDVEHQQLVMAALLDLAAEMNRRVPVPRK